MARSFAHLVGLGRARAAEETDDERRDREEREEEERDGKMRAAEDNGEDTGESEEEKEARHRREAARRRAKGEEDPDAGDEEEEGDDDSDREEARGHGTVARARRRERGRIAAILSSPQAAANLPLAVDLACNTVLTRAEAVRILARSPMPRALDRSSRNPRLAPGSGAPAAGGRHSEIQAMWSDAFARVVPAMRRMQRGAGR